MTAPIRPIHESYWVEPGRFLAGEYPTAAFVGRARKRLNNLLESGIDTFYDLTLLNELPPYLPVLREEASKHGVRVQHIRFPILDHNIPPRGMMIAILDTIDGALARGRNIYLHCWGGIGRTGTVVGCYLVRRGLTGEQALEQLAGWWKDVPKSSYFPRSPETDRQVLFVVNWWENLPTTPPSPDPPTRPTSEMSSAIMDWNTHSAYQANRERKLLPALLRRIGFFQLRGKILRRKRRPDQ